MHKRYDALYLSPHLDDAALSCGGQIHQQTAAGKKVLVATIMAGDPGTAVLSAFAHSLHDRWQLAQTAVAARRREDMTACRILGADFFHFSIPDCIYRRTADSGIHMYQSGADIFGEIHPAEKQLPAKIADLLRSLPPAEKVYVPMGVGQHVDHQLTRKAAYQIFGSNLCYYPDYPYVRLLGSLEAFVAQEPFQLADTVPLNREDLDARVASIAAFQSQVSTFFQDLQDLENQIAAYCAKVGGEQRWILAE